MSERPTLEIIRNGKRLQTCKLCDTLVDVSTREKAKDHARNCPVYQLKEDETDV